MYKKSVQGWLKHLDFMILDVVCLWISFTLAFNMRHGSLDVLANSLYRDMMWSLALMDIVVIFFFDSLKNVLKRGFYQEFVMTVKQTCLITLCSVFYLFTFKEAENYSRLVLGYTAALYLLISYVLRCLWKNCLRKYFGGAEKRSLLIVTVSDIVDTVIDNIKNKNYGDYFVTGVCMLDKKAKGRVIDGVTVVADEDDLVEYVCREWVDEVFINIPESEPYPAELLDKFIEMGVVVHMKLAKSQNLLGKKQFVEHLGTYTVLTTSINSVSRRQIILKRMMDIAGGLAGCIITGILCIFVGPAIYIQSPGPIFFKQTRVGKNGKMFQMYKFRSMYMDAEERKAELMKENRVQDGMMFKLDFDPRIIGSKKLPDGTIKKGVGNFIRDWSLDEFPQFLNVLKGDMSLVGTRPPTVDEWDKYELHHRARLATKPGLTGMWQVSGRSNITDFEEVVKLDKQYISEWTMGLDDLTYMLDFADKDAVKIAYASSVGTMWESEDRETVKNLLKRFQNIGVREHSIQKELDILIGKKVDFVCDPTMLLTAEQWKSMSAPRSIEGDYVLCYMSDPKLEMYKDAIQYGKKHHLPVYLISYGWVPEGMKAIRPNGVEEFISLVSNAHTVFTASYHGMLFSLYFNRNFYYYNRGWKERMKSIAEYLQLTDREHWSDEKDSAVIDYALTYYGIGTCPLIWNDDGEKAEEIRRFVDIPWSEQIVAIIQVGHYATNECKYAASNRRAVFDVLKIH